MTPEPPTPLCARLFDAFNLAITPKERELFSDAIAHITALTAERDELQAKVDLVNHYIPEAIKHGDINKALSARVEGLEADKARLDWLEETKCHVVWSDRQGGFFIQERHQVCGNIACCPTARAAIDKARAALESP